ncbi:hypothetical protein M0R72_01900 [Candidatus Pacearchaeota archaeon]|jgi:hypothetical protein|nr:hypothetical protein [Candidatus Pacearchaeota archaeon]
MPRSPFVNGPGTQLPDNQRIGFMPTNKEVVATRGVKLRTKAAIQKEQDQQEREEYKARFEENADKTVKYHDEKSKKAIDIITRYHKLTEDKTLFRNRGSIATDVEREIRQQIIQLALDMNNDENEEDNGKGSVVVLSVVTKILLMYRDRLNDLEYEIQQLKRELHKVSSASAQQTSNATK